MVLLAEMVRDLSKELVLLNVATVYTRNTNSWGTVHDYGNVTLTEDSVLILSYLATHGRYGVGGTTCAHKVKIGSQYVAGFQFASYPENITNTVVFFLAAGTYDVLVEGAGDYLNVNSYEYIQISDFKLGIVKFSDTDGDTCSSLVAYAGAINKTLAIRTTPIGPLAKGTMHIQVMSENGASVAALPTVSVDAVAQSWAWSKVNQSAGTYFNSYGGVSGRIDIPLSAGVSHSVTIAGGTGTHYISIVFSPWILPTLASKVVSLSFPDGSTLYVTSEPLMANPTKNLKIGEGRGISFGDATDYYYTSSGIGILASTYTFEIVSLDGCIMVVYGYGGCVSSIAVDVR
jgi:hypothetical protein